jgi:DNA topoisomerase-1
MSSSRPSLSRVAAEAKVHARQVGLRYVNANAPGLRRTRKGSSFVYLQPDGRRVRDAATLARVKSLAIPPAWTEVWICPDGNGHLQATGRDEKGRKQSRYHPEFRAAREMGKYERVIEFAKALPSIRRTTRRHLRLPGLPREKVLAAVVKLLEKTLIRVGNEQYAKAHKHFGLTTIHNKHVQVKGRTLKFKFVGKSGVPHEVEIEGPRLARVVRRCQELPEQQLFEYIDNDGNRRDVKSDDVNEYLKEITGREFTAKDFRTWAGTVLAAQALAVMQPCDRPTQQKKNIVAAVEQVARRLGNTKAVCRKCYIHPAIINSYVDGSLRKVIATRATEELQHLGSDHELEHAVMRLVRKAMLQKGTSRKAA